MCALVPMDPSGGSAKLRAIGTFEFAEWSEDRLARSVGPLGRRLVGFVEDISWNGMRHHFFPRGFELLKDIDIMESMKK